MITNTLLILYIFQVERLLRTIYQPQNVYCIHPDLKSPEGFHKAIRRLADCFDNVFVASKLEKVQWGGISGVLANLHCMEDLLRRPVQWKYYINLCGQDFPLKTNLEIVRQLKAYAPLNCIASNPSLGTSYEIRCKYKYYSPSLDEPPKITIPPQQKGKPPFQLYKGNTYIAATREFIDFVVNSNISRTFVAWLNDTFIPDETFTLSLNRLPQAPGGYDIPSNESNVRFRRWHSSNSKCLGKYVRGYCIFNAEYLQFLRKRRELFVNKFHYDFDPVAMQCMEELLENRTRHPQQLSNDVENFPITNYPWQQRFFSTMERIITTAKP